VGEGGGDEAVAPGITLAGTKGLETCGDSVFTRAWVPGLTPSFLLTPVPPFSCIRNLFWFSFSVRHEPNNLQQQGFKKKLLERKNGDDYVLPASVSQGVADSMYPDTESRQLPASVSCGVGNSAYW
jgi:hypothetical protein